MPYIYQHIYFFFFIYFHATSQQLARRKSTRSLPASAMWNFLQQQLFVLLVFLFSDELISVLNRRSVLQHRKPICKDIADPIRYHGTVEADGTLIETSNGTLTINGTINGTSKTKKETIFNI